MLFTYRIREKNDGSGYQNYPKWVNQKDRMPEKFRFVQNLFSLMSLSVRNCLLSRSPKGMLLWDGKVSQALGKEQALQNVTQEFIKNSKKHAIKFSRDISQVPQEKLFEAYISKFYSIRECEEYLFGSEESPRSISPISLPQNPSTAAS